MVTDSLVRGKALTHSTVVTLFVLFIHTDENDRGILHRFGHRFQHSTIDVIHVQPNVVVQRLVSDKHNRIGYVRSHRYFQAIANFQTHCCYGPIVRDHNVALKLARLIER